MSTLIVRLVSLGLALTTFGVVPAVAGARQASASELLASVGPRQAISLRLGDGTAVARLKAGRYTIVVSDRSRKDDFHLTGNVDRKTGIAFVGTQRWTVRLTKGRYRYRSDAHPRTLRATFTVY